MEPNGTGNNAGLFCSTLFLSNMARRRKSPVKGFLLLAAAVAGGAYFGDDLKAKFQSVTAGLTK